MEDIQWYVYTKEGRVYIRARLDGRGISDFVVTPQSATQLRNKLNIILKDESLHTNN